MIETRQAVTAEEQEAVYRFRYSVYVEEMGRYRTTADHANKRLVDPEDAYSWNFFAHDGTQIVASNRITWGADGFSPHQIEQYELAPFLAELPPHVLFVGERTMVAPAYRGTDVVANMATDWPVPEEDVLVVFGVCEPHLVSYYAQMGSVPYADHNIGSDESGYLVPLISFPQGLEALDGLGAEPGLPRCIRDVVEGRCAVTSPVIIGDDAYWRELELVLGLLQRPGAFFEGLCPDEVKQCIARSNVIDCREGDRVLKQGGTARNVFVVLSGALEARDADRAIGRLQPGDVFGETAFLLQRDRTLDVYAVEPQTRILSLSERTLRSITSGGGELATKLLLNISKALCARAAGRVRSAA